MNLPEGFNSFKYIWWFSISIVGQIKRVYIATAFLIIYMRYKSNVGNTGREYYKIVQE